MRFTRDGEGDNGRGSPAARCGGTTEKSDKRWEREAQQEEMGSERDRDEEMKGER